MERARPDVLVVDDDPVTAAVAAAYLGNHGISVATCSDGAQMWAFLDWSVPAVIVLDVEMPGEDGFALADQLRRRYGLTVVIIMLTMHAGRADLAMGMEAGADDYLTKPCNWRMLVGQVKKYLATQRHGGMVPPPLPALVRDVADQ